jgi:hypothetical protein
VRGSMGGVGWGWRAAGVGESGLLHASLIAQLPLRHPSHAYSRLLLNAHRCIHPCVRAGAGAVDRRGDAAAAPGAGGGGAGAHR